MTINLQSELWAITSFFNPLHYERRVANYYHFRRHLNVPLVTVELGYDGKFQLSSVDAEIVVQFRGVSTLWQKENLLNIALSQLPSHVRFVAWLDCDIRFLDPDWDIRVATALRTHKLLQLFSELHDLEVDTDPACNSTLEAPTGLSATSLMLSGRLGPSEFRPSNSLQVRRSAFGLAWAAEREMMSHHGFYEAAILGSGDRAMFCAAVGRFEDAISALHMNQARKIHYLRWAEPFFEGVAGQVACLPGKLAHLWHGDFADRHYASRHRRFNLLSFDPEIDLRRDDKGVISWNPARSDLEAFARGYFCSRREDGTNC